MRRALVIFGSVFALTLPTLAVAHGFGQRIDLPVPLYLYLFGGGAIVALSFILLGLVPKRLSESLHAYPRYELTQFAWFRVITSKTALVPLQVLFVFVLVVAVVSGLFGDQNPAFNVLPTVVWILFAIGITFVSALIGNVWSVVNPFATLCRYSEVLLKKFRIIWESVPMSASWGVWPAVVLFFVFRWVENVSGVSSEPRSLALFILAYTAITFYGMATYGKEVWLKRGDPFSVFFSFLSRFSITEVGEDKKVYLRPPGVGLLNKTANASVSEVAFVLLMLSSVAADGMLGTPFFLGISRVLFGIGLPWVMVGTVSLLGLFGAFCAVYYGFSYLTRIFSGDTSSVLDVAKRFIFSLLPIAIAYEIAHYVSILVIEGQRALYLISDPFGKGWNLFGTANYEVNYTVLNLKTLWNVQVGLIVVGHVVAVVIAHAIAERYFKDRRKALISQYPMLLLMIFYSCLSLWIMAQPIVAVN
jgi:hypothetical protein